MNNPKEPLIVWDEPNFAGRLLNFVAGRLRAAIGISGQKRPKDKYVHVGEQDVFLTEFSARGAFQSEQKAALRHSLPELSPIPLPGACVYVKALGSGELSLAIVPQQKAAEFEKERSKRVGFAVQSDSLFRSFHFDRWRRVSRARANGRALSLVVFFFACYGALSIIETEQGHRVQELSARIAQQRAELLKQAEIKSRQSKWQSLKATNPIQRTPNARLADLVLLKDLTSVESYWASVSVQKERIAISGTSQDAIALLGAVNAGLQEGRRAEFSRAVSISGDGWQSFEIVVLDTEGGAQ